MKKELTKMFFFTFLLICLVSPGMAQRTTQTGNLIGTVADDQNNILPGVTVTVSSPALLLPQVSVVTDRKGFFRIPHLPVGMYKVVFEMDHFTTIIREGIIILLGDTVSLDITMEPSKIAEAVTVVGQSPVVDTRKTSLGLNIDHNIIQHIPSPRHYEGVFQMAPGVTESDGRSTSHGATVRDNSYNVDGVSITDPVTGLFGSVQVGYEVAEEYQVETGGHSAEYGSVRGSVLNLVTKSGGNNFSGEANFYYRSKGLQSDNTKGTPFEGAFVGTNYDYDTALQFGGPIIKNRLWFFSSIAQTYSETFVEGYPYDKNEHTPEDYKKTFPFLKLSLQINPSMKLVGSWIFWLGTRNNRGASRFMNEDTTWKGNFVSNTLNLSYSYIISNNLIFTAKCGLVLVDLDYVAKNDLPLYYDYATLLYSGSYGYDQLIKRNSAQFLTDATYFVDDFYGRHEFKTGFEFEFGWDESELIFNKDPRNGLGYRIYTRNNGQPYLARDYESYKRIDHKFLYGMYIQDSWSPTKRLTLNLGIRFDRQEAVIPEQAQDRTPVTYMGVIYDPRVLESFKPFVWNTFSPRLGANFDLTGDGKTVIKSSYGRYYLSGIVQFFYLANPNGNIIRYYQLNSDWSIKKEYSFYASAATEVDPDLKAPYLDELIVGITRELAHDFSLSVNYIRKWDRRLLEDVIVEALDVESLKKGEFIWSHFTPVTVIDPFTGQPVTFYNQEPGLTTQSPYITNPEPAKRDYTGFEILLSKRFSKNWQLMASYVYSKAVGITGLSQDETSSTTGLFSNPNSHINAFGRLPNERRHQIKVQGTYQAPFGIFISTYYRGYAGERYTRVIQSSDLGITLNQGSVSILAEEKGSRGLPWLHIWDVRVEKQFRIKDQFGIGVMLDAFNILNLNTTTSVETISSSSAYVFEQVVGIMDPRVFRVGLRIIW